MKNKILGLVAACGLALAASTAPAFAGTAQNNINLTATLTATCTLDGGSPVSFGDFHGDAVSINSVALTAQCSPGTTYTVTADTGANGANAVGTTRALKSGSNYLNYELYTDAAYGNVFNATSGVHVYSGSSTGAAVPLTVYERIPVQTIPPAGTYTDTVVATLTF